VPSAAFPGAEQRLAAAYVGPAELLVAGKELDPVAAVRDAVQTEVLAVDTEKRPAASGAVSAAEALVAAYTA
jgi:hypothetical protein